VPLDPFAELLGSGRGTNVQQGQVAVERLAREVAECHMLAAVYGDLRASYSDGPFTLPAGLYLTATHTGIDPYRAVSLALDRLIVNESGFHGPPPAADMPPWQRQLVWAPAISERAHKMGEQLTEIIDLACPFACVADHTSSMELWGNVICFWVNWGAVRRVLDTLAQEINRMQQNTRHP
jgi:hypothetical protein